MSKCVFFYTVFLAPRSPAVMFRGVHIHTTLPQIFGRGPWTLRGTVGFAVCGGRCKEGRHTKMSSWWTFLPWMCPWGVLPMLDKCVTASPHCPSAGTDHRGPLDKWPGLFVYLFGSCYAFPCLSSNTRTSSPILGLIRLINWCNFEAGEPF